MARTVGIGIQDFEKVIENDCFYVDKTDFIREWWESMDSVTLIARPRRFGKTLNMSMLDYFFSTDHAGRGDLFEGLSVWEDERYRKLQGTYPVINLSFARVKELDYASAKRRLCRLIAELHDRNLFLLDGDTLSEREKKDFIDLIDKKTEISEENATTAIYNLSGYLYRYYGKKVIILLDEYDTPMQEAFVNGYWEEAVGFIRNLFNSTFKTNPYLERAIMTGITRVSKESVFSDLNNLNVVTTTSNQYATAFGFTEDEVFAALDECGRGDKKEDVKRWYDGFIFGEQRDIYNPWSIINFLNTGKIEIYWANTSSNSLVSKLIREGSPDLKEEFKELLQGKRLRVLLDEQIVYSQLNGSEHAIWSLLVAGGYLKVCAYETYGDIPEGSDPRYELAITNLEVKVMFQNMVRDWFSVAGSDYNGFVRALLADDVDAMNEYMNRVSLQVFSSFDTGRGTSCAQPERFYHGFVLGLMVDLQNRYVITSNRESGFGRYDVMLEPREKNQDAYILEFKVRNRRREETLEDTLRAAHAQIEEKLYEAVLVARGIPVGNIRKYGVAFEGKTVLIG